MTKNRILIGITTCVTVLAFSSPVLSNPPNILLKVNGNVTIKRVNWIEFKKAKVGDLLNQNDQIQLDSKASATILCNNTEKWQVKPGEIYQVLEGCPSGVPTETRPNVFRIPTRGENKTIPYIISPRNTALLNNRPLLRWNEISGATAYKVRLQDVGLTLDWQIETTNTQIEYPSDKPLLQTGFYYLLSVETDKGKSSNQEEGFDLSFYVLDIETAELVKTEITKIKQLNLTPEAEGLALAYLYQSYELKAEAIELLEGLVKQGSQITAVYQLLGNLYLQVGLSNQAKNPYEKALELAKQNDDIQGQAEAQSSTTTS